LLVQVLVVLVVLVLLVLVLLEQVQVLVSFLEAGKLSACLPLKR
jgi:hypothetical protein